jgi:hypothetical protein
VNPRIGSDLQYGREVEEEESVEVVRNHEDGTRMGIGVPISKVARSKADPSRKAEEKRSSVPAQPRSEARSIDAETRRGGQRSERAATERTGHRSEAATRSEGVPGSDGDTQSEA